MNNAQTPLTSEQKLILAWFRADNWLEICAELGPAHGRMNASSSCEKRIFQKTIHKLLKLGFIRQRTIRHFGVRWQRFEAISQGQGAVCG